MFRLFSSWEERIVFDGYYFIEGYIERTIDGKDIK